MADYIKWFSIFEFFFIFTIIPNYFLNASGHEKFNLKMVLLFTSINVVGIITGLLIYKTSVGMLIGLAFSTIVSMFILHYKIAQKFNSNKKSILNIALLFIPSFFGSGTAWFDNYSLKLLFFILCIFSLYFIYIKYYKTNFKVLTE
jgi:O-antigen/teichoic acid export membrane protein